MIEWFDETCGALLDHLEQQGLADHTIVAYLADNGWIQSPDRTRFAPKSKTSQYDGGLRTPMMIRWPGKIRPRRIDAPASSVDLMPTLLRLCGVAAPPRLPGIDLLDDKAVASRPGVFGACFAHDAVDLDQPSTSLNWRWCVSGRWKLIVPNLALQTNSPDELYDLGADPLETRNLAPARAAKAKQLKDLVDRWWDGL
jgi:uncharacterized sulfatase